MRRLSIRLKLAVALALPLHLALVIVTAIAVRATADTANDTWLIVLTVATVGAAVLAFVVSQSITEPLRSLTAQAKDMAERRLPERGRHPRHAARRRRGPSRQATR